MIDFENLGPHFGLPEWGLSFLVTHRAEFVCPPPSLLTKSVSELDREHVPAGNDFTSPLVFRSGLA